MPTASIIQIVDTATGGATIDLQTQDTNTGYFLTEGGWAPAMARLRTSPLGSLGAYSEVEEAITAEVYAPTNTALLANTAVLSQMMGKIDSIDKGNITAPIQLQAQILGSAHSSPLYTTLTGGGKADSTLQLPDTWHDGPLEVQGAVLHMKRQGLWYDPIDDTVTTANVTAGDATLSTFSTNTPIPSPLQLVFNNIPYAVLAGATSSFLIVAPTARIWTQEGDVWPINSGSTFVSMSDATAHGGQYVRHTPVYASHTTAVFNPPTSFDKTAIANRQIAIYGVVRTSNSAAQWTLQMSVTAGGITQAMPATIVQNLTNPTPIALGTIVLPAAPTAMTLTITNNAPNTGIYLDMDYFVIVGVNDITSRVLQLGSLIAPAAAAGSTPVMQTVAWHKQNRAGVVLQQTQSSVLYESSLTPIGSADLVTSDNAVTCIWMICGGTNSGVPTGYWRLTNSGTVVAMTLNAIRTKGYLVPE